MADKRIRRMFNSHRQCPVRVIDPALANTRDAQQLQAVSTGSNRQCPLAVTVIVLNTRDANLWRAHCKKLSDTDDGGFY